MLRKIICWVKSRMILPRNSSLSVLLKEKMRPYSVYSRVRMPSQNILVYKQPWIIIWDLYFSDLEFLAFPTRWWYYFYTTTQHHISKVNSYRLMPIQYSPPEPASAQPFFFMDHLSRLVRLSPSLVDTLPDKCPPITPSSRQMPTTAGRSRLQQTASKGPLSWGYTFGSRRRTCHGRAALVRKATSHSI